MSPQAAKSGKVKRTARRSPPARAPRFLVIGKVARPHGIRGELRLEVHTGSPAHLNEVQTVYLGVEHTPYRLESFRLHQTALLISIEGCDTRDAAEKLRGEWVAVKLEEAVPLREGEYYHHQIIGLNVVTAAGEDLGTVTEIIQTGANDVYVVRGPVGEVLLPAIKSVILKIEPPQMVVQLPEGLR